MIQYALPTTPFIPHPVTGKTFIGRPGRVRNLRGRIANGESVAIIGGPKLGKTSLVRTTLESLPDRRVIEVDFSRGAIADARWLPTENAVGRLSLLNDFVTDLTPDRIE